VRCLYFAAERLRDDALDIDLDIDIDVVQKISQFTS
jgi:hypothetical protein